MANVLKQVFYLVLILCKFNNVLSSSHLNSDQSLAAALLQSQSLSSPSSGDAPNKENRKNNRVQRSFQWPSFFGGSNNNDDTIVAGSDSSLATVVNPNITVATIVPSGAATDKSTTIANGKLPHYPVYRIHKYNGVVVNPMPISYIPNSKQYFMPSPLVPSSRNVATNNRTVTSPEILTPISDSKSEVKDSDTAASSSKYDLKKIARSIGITNVKNLPTIDDVMDLFGAESRDEALKMIQEYISNENGIALVKNYLASYSDTDDIESEDDNTDAIISTNKNINANDLKGNVESDPLITYTNSGPSQPQSQQSNIPGLPASTQSQSFITPNQQQYWQQQQQQQQYWQQQQQQQLQLQRQQPQLIIRGLPAPTQSQLFMTPNQQHYRQQQQQRSPPPPPSLPHGIYRLPNGGQTYGYTLQQQHPTSQQQSIWRRGNVVAQTAFNNNNNNLINGQRQPNQSYHLQPIISRLDGALDRTHTDIGLLKEITNNRSPITQITSSQNKLQIVTPEVEAPTPAAPVIAPAPAIALTPAPAIAIASATPVTVAPATVPPTPSPTYSPIVSYRLPQLPEIPYQIVPEINGNNGIHSITNLPNLPNLPNLEIQYASAAPVRDLSNAYNSNNYEPSLQQQYAHVGELPLSSNYDANLQSLSSYGESTLPYLTNDLVDIDSNGSASEQQLHIVKPPQPLFMAYNNAYGSSKINKIDSEVAQLLPFTVRLANREQQQPQESRQERTVVPNKINNIPKDSTMSEIVTRLTAFGLNKH